VKEGIEKEVEYEGRKYKYHIDKYTMYKDYYAITVSGGPYNASATTTCEKASLKETLKALISKLQHK